MENVELKTYWNEEIYQKEKQIWGLEPSNAAKRLVSRLQNDDYERLKILDMGCGYGRDTHFFSQIGMKAFGIDFAEEGIYLARKTESKASFLVNDVLNINFEDNFFDVLFCNCVVQWFGIQERVKAIQEAFRVTKIGGLVIFCIPEFGSENETECIFKYNGLSYFKRDALQEFNIYGSVWIENVTEYHDHEGQHDHSVYMIFARKGD